MSGKYLTEEAKKALRARRRSRRAVVSLVLRGSVILAVLAVIILNLFTHIFQVVHYSGKGMEPRLKSGQTLVLHKTQDVAPGDIIAFYYNNQVLIRRVIATENQQVTIESDGSVTINGQLLEESYLSDPSLGQCNLEFPYRVPTGCFFVMGDSRMTAMDSRLRQIGPIPRDRIIGKLLFSI